MNPDKNYYTILGLMPDAEDVVIVAAYRALVGRYHPDRWVGDPLVAHSRTVELNEAYSVLSDPERRREYDQIRFKAGYSFSEDDAEDKEFDAAFAALEQRWRVATEIYPDLIEEREKLSKIAHRLAFAFVLHIMETRRFSNRKEISESMQTEFLRSYFGSNPEILFYARSLISAGLRAPLKRLNLLIDVMGDEVPARLIIEKIEMEFGIDRERRRAAEAAKDVELSEKQKIKARHLLTEMLQGNEHGSYNAAVDLLIILGGRYTWTPIKRGALGVLGKHVIVVEFNSEKQTFGSSDDFFAWAKAVLPGLL